MVLQNSLIPFNLSESLGYMLILPPATGSRQAIEIFKNFPFGTFYLSKGKLIYRNPGVTHTHNPYLFPGHEKYKAIMTCKNPYSKWASRFRLHLAGQRMIKSSFDIKKVFYNTVMDQFYSNCSSITKDLGAQFFTIEKEISYRIRTENILEDYRSIPFIGGSDFDKSGKLEELLNKNVGKFEKRDFKIEFPEDWRDLFNQEIADLIYNLFESHFKYHGYEKDSWKK